MNILIKAIYFYAFLFVNEYMFILFNIAFCLNRKIYYKYVITIELLKKKKTRDWDDAA